MNNNGFILIENKYYRKEDIKNIEIQSYKIRVSTPDEEIYYFVKISFYKNEDEYKAKELFLMPPKKCNVTFEEYQNRERKKYKDRTLSIKESRIIWKELEEEKRLENAKQLSKDLVSAIMSDSFEIKTKINFSTQDFAPHNNSYAQSELDWKLAYCFSKAR